MDNLLFSQTKTRFLVTEENGTFEIVDPMNECLIITDIDISISKPQALVKMDKSKDFELILRLIDISLCALFFLFARYTRTMIVLLAR